MKVHPVYLMNEDQRRLADQANIFVPLIYMYATCNQMSAVVAPSGECLRSEGLVWLIGRWCVSCCRGSNCSLARAMDGRIQRCSTIGSCRSTATSDDCKARLVGFPCKTRYIRIPGFSFRTCLYTVVYESK